MNHVPLFGLAAVCMFAFAVTADTTQFTPINNFDLSKYLGTWYEIARMPTRFERTLVNVTATYTRNDDGTVTVLNQGYKYSRNGKKKTAKGKAKFASSPDIGHLRVSFFGPFYADYIIIALDTVNYQYAMVTGGSHKYLWILSRTPSMDSAHLQALLDQARTLGFDLTKLYMVPQD